MASMKPALAHDAYMIAENQMRRGTYSDAKGVMEVARDHLWPRYHTFFSDGEFQSIVGGACEIAEIERDLATPR